MISWESFTFQWDHHHNRKIGHQGFGKEEKFTSQKTFLCTLFNLIAYKLIEMK